MLRDFRSSLLSGSLVHHWGGRSVPSTCFHAFPICFPSLFLWFCSLGPQTLLCYYLSPTCLPLLFPVCGGLGTRIFPLLYLLLVSHLSFASLSVLSLKWKTWFVYRWTPPFSHFRLCAAAFGLLFAFQFISFLTCIWSHGRHQFGAWCFLLLFGLSAV